MISIKMAQKNIVVAKAKIHTFLLWFKRSVTWWGKYRICEERSDEAIFTVQVINEIGALRSQIRSTFHHSWTVWTAGIQKCRRFISIWITRSSRVMTLSRTLPAVTIISVALLMTGCQGNPFSKPPIHIVPNMDNQPKYKAQAKGAFFDNGSAMRMPIEGTVARGLLKESDEYYRGRDSKTGEFVKNSPVATTMSGLKRGQERFDIYCAVCHGQSGDGRGIMIEYKYVPPPTFHSDLVREYPDGHIFDVISNGKGNMPAYAAQIKVEDRWLIINYLRTLQFSQHAAIDDLPPDVRNKLVK